jgi:hypothetical protein
MTELSASTPSSFFVFDGVWDRIFCDRDGLMGNDGRGCCCRGDNFRNGDELGGTGLLLTGALLGFGLLLLPGVQTSSENKGVFFC